MKIVLKGWVYAQQYSWDKPDEWKYSFFSGQKIDACASENGTGYLPVMPYEVELDGPADWNPIQHMVAGLEAERAEVIADYQKSVASINERLGKLLALTNGAAPPAPDAAA